MKHGVLRNRAAKWFKKKCIQRLCFMYLEAQLALEEPNSRRRSQLLAGYQRRIPEQDAAWGVAYTRPHVPEPNAGLFQQDLDAMEALLGQPIPDNDVVWMDRLGKEGQPPRHLVVQAMQLLVFRRLRTALRLEPVAHNANPQLLANYQHLRPTSVFGPFYFT